MRGSSFGYLLKEGAKNIYANRMMSFASIGTLVACMLLIGSFLLFSLNINQAVGYVEQQNEVEVELDDALNDSEIKEVDTALKSITNVYEREFVSKEVLMNELKAQSDDLAVLLDGLEEDNPLYNSYRVKIKDLSQLSGTVMKLEAIEGVSEVRAPDMVGEVMTNVKYAVSSAGFFIVIILLVVSLVIMGNTIKVTVFNRRKEINIMKYVGATDAFIRLPFFVEGFLIGLLSALVSFGLLWVGYNYILDVIAQNPSTWMTQVYSNLILFEDIALNMLGWFAGGGVFIGVFGSMFFVNKYLKV